MKQYGFIIYSPAPADPNALPPEYEEGLERYGAQIDELEGRFVAGYAFEPSTTAKTARGDSVTDGTFHDDTKEVIAGFAVIEAPNLDAAIRIATLNPATRQGGVELRPLFVPPAEE